MADTAKKVWLEMWPCEARHYQMHLGFGTQGTDVTDLLFRNCDSNLLKNALYRIVCDEFWRQSSESNTIVFAPCRK